MHLNRKHSGIRIFQYIIVMLSTFIDLKNIGNVNQYYSLNYKVSMVNNDLKITYYVCFEMRREKSSISCKSKLVSCSIAASTPKVS